MALASIPVDVVAEALKAANIIRSPHPEPQKPQQKRKPRVLKPLLQLGQPCDPCKLIFFDSNTNHKLVYDRLYIKCQARVDEITKKLGQANKEKDHYKSLSLVLAEQLLQMTKERDYYKSLCGNSV